MKISWFVLIGSMLSYGCFGQSSDDYTQPAQLYPAQFSSRELLLRGDSIMQDELLYQLYPAPMDENNPDYLDWKTTAYWSCDSCEKMTLTDWNNAEDTVPAYITFPFEVNYTDGSYDLSYEKNGSRYHLWSFCTAENNEGVGRFVSGVLSLALFQKEPDGWKLIRFNPAVNYQGAFTNCDPPDSVIQIGNTIYFSGIGGISNGISVEDYWPLFSDLFLYNENLEQLIRLRYAVCRLNGDYGSNWTSEIMFSPKWGQDGLMVYTSGVLYRDAFWEGPEFMNKINVNRLLTENQFLPFEIIHEFNLKGNQFVETDVLIRVTLKSGAVKEYHLTETSRRYQ